jgi:hypothetical protein
MLTPADYVASHEITQQLKGLGVTNTQLDGMKFRPNNTGRPFAQRTFTWGAGTPLAAIPHILPYCALKWLILENPESSRDKDDASLLVSATMAAPIYRAGISHMRAQRLRAKKPRGKVTDDGRTLDEVIEILASKLEYRKLSTPELWPHFHAELTQHGLDPEELDPGNLRKSAYAYDFNGKRKIISYRRFANLVSEYRKQSR